MNQDERNPQCIDRPVDCVCCGRTVMLSDNHALNEVGMHCPRSDGNDVYVCMGCDPSYERGTEA